MSWELTSDRPIYLQLAEHIKIDIMSGKYQPGSKIESVRELAIEASVNPNTMQKAMSYLEQTGLIYSNRTSGRFITDDEEKIISLKKSLADKYCADFITKVRYIGYNDEDIKGIVTHNLQQEYFINVRRGLYGTIIRMSCTYQNVWQHFSSQ